MAWTSQAESRFHRHAWYRVAAAWDRRPQAPLLGLARRGDRGALAGPLGSGAATFEAPNPAGPAGRARAEVGGRPKLFILDMFPYPVAAAGLHVGHPLGYIGTDVYGRFQRMNGRNVLHPMGCDAFGLPAEQYADPDTASTRSVTTDQQHRQLPPPAAAAGPGPRPAAARSATTDPAYYRWTQWIFLQIFNAWYDADAGPRPARSSELIDELERPACAPTPTRAWDPLRGLERRLGRATLDRLAYTSERRTCRLVPRRTGRYRRRWRPTGHGRPQAIDGNLPVLETHMRQWMMRITAYRRPPHRRPAT